MNRHHLLLPAVLAGLLATACSAGTPAPVTLKNLTAGDRGCYVEVSDAAGATQEHLASFEVCERTELVGQRVTLEIRTESVAAESCQGDPECTQSEQVPLVVTITPAK